MADDPIPNSLNPAVRNRSVVEGDVPDHLRRRYYVDGRGGAGLGFYADAKIKAPTFRDRGKQLVAARSDPNAIRDMTAIAKHRGWTIVTARGDPAFRREAWLAGRSAGIEVRGYRPNERDIQELDRRIDRRLGAQSRASGRREGEPEEADRSRFRARDPANDPAARSRLKVVEAVTRARVADPDVRERIVAKARGRISDWLERGATLKQLSVRQQGRRDAERTPQRSRGR